MVRDCELGDRKTYLENRSRHGGTTVVVSRLCERLCLQKDLGYMYNPVGALR